ncbi:hypothetical protein FISHEDRAFT_76014 [Fistulina hepatica ATCC 64428]|uniref:Uncharacterized protein n=1 Tax=Fistulina hepatica ATCC 64428 TaxID=1128425 RepID=A0A0D7A5S1_9AGAR|nr:hypothetical protein FISHEDRAFT_76014 [Fistulina hepatica ATCC 64428]
MSLRGPSSAHRTVPSSDKPETALSAPTRTSDNNTRVAANVGDMSSSSHSGLPRRTQDSVRGMLPRAQTQPVASTSSHVSSGSPTQHTRAERKKQSSSTSAAFLPEHLSMKRLLARPADRHHHTLSHEPSVGSGIPQPMSRSRSISTHSQKYHSSTRTSPASPSTERGTPATSPSSRLRTQPTTSPHVSPTTLSPRLSPLTSSIPSTPSSPGARSPGHQAGKRVASSSSPPVPPRSSSRSLSRSEPTSVSRSTPSILSKSSSLTADEPGTLGLAARLKATRPSMLSLSMGQEHPSGNKLPLATVNPSTTGADPSECTSFLSLSPSIPYTPNIGTVASSPQVVVVPARRHPNVLRRRPSAVSVRNLTPPNSNKNSPGLSSSAPGTPTASPGFHSLSSMLSRTPTTSKGFISRVASHFVADPSSEDVHGSLSRQEHIEESRRHHLPRMPLLMDMVKRKPSMDLFLHKETVTSARINPTRYTARQTSDADELGTSPANRSITVSDHIGTFGRKERRDTTSDKLNSLHSRPTTEHPPRSTSQQPPSQKLKDGHPSQVLWNEEQSLRQRRDPWPVDSSTVDALRGLTMRSKSVDSRQRNAVGQRSERSTITHETHIPKTESIHKWTPGGRPLTVDSRRSAASSSRPSVPGSSFSLTSAPTDSASRTPINDAHRRRSISPDILPTPVMPDGYASSHSQSSSSRLPRPSFSSSLPRSGSGVLPADTSDKSHSSIGYQRGRYAHSAPSKSQSSLSSIRKDDVSSDLPSSSVSESLQDRQTSRGAVQLLQGKAVEDEPATAHVSHEAGISSSDDVPGPLTPASQLVFDYRKSTSLLDDGGNYSPERDDITMNLSGLLPQGTASPSAPPRSSDTGVAVASTSLVPTRTRSPVSNSRPSASINHSTTSLVSSSSIPSRAHSSSSVRIEGMPVLMAAPTHKVSADSTVSSPVDYSASPQEEEARLPYYTVIGSDHDWMVGTSFGGAQVSTGYRHRHPSSPKKSISKKVSMRFKKESKTDDESDQLSRGRKSSSGDAERAVEQHKASFDDARLRINHNSEPPKGGGSRLWKLMKRISASGLKEKFDAKEEVPPVPSLPVYFKKVSDGFLSVEKGESRQPEAWITAGDRKALSVDTQRIVVPPIPPTPFTLAGSAHSLNHRSTTTRSSTPDIDSSDDKFFGTATRRSSFSSDGTPAKDNAASYIMQHIVSPDKLQKLMAQDDEPEVASPIDFRNAKKPVTKGSLDYPVADTTVEKLPSLPHPPRSRGHRHSQTVVVQPWSRDSPRTPTFSRLRTSESEGLTSTRSSSPLIPTFSSEQPINTFAQKRALAEINKKTTTTSLPTSASSVPSSSLPPPPRPTRNPIRASSAPRPSKSSTQPSLEQPDSPAKPEHRRRQSNPQPSTTSRYREMSALPIRILSDEEKVDKWDDLLRRSDRAGGTLHMGNEPLPSDSLRYSTTSTTLDGLF